MQRAMEMQRHLNDGVQSVQKHSREKESSLSAQIDRLQSQLTVKKSDVMFLRKQLETEREQNSQRLNNLQTKQHTHVTKLVAEIDTLRSEVNHVEKQREEHARNNLASTDTLNKAVCNFIFKLGCF